MRLRYLPVIALLAVSVAGTLTARRHGSRANGTRANNSAPFDYYVLALSWAPEFCSDPARASRSPEECAPGKPVGFIVHGLWPQSIQGRSPEGCGAGGEIPQSAEQIALPDMLSPSLIRHEWEAHGTCTGLSPVDYFTALAKARSAVQIPRQITSINRPVSASPAQLETEFTAANPSFPTGAFRTWCPRSELQEERICFEKNLQPRACTPAVEECRSPSVTIRPPL